MLDTFAMTQPVRNQGYPASSVVMVPPRTFMYNTQTGEDNEFQHQLNLSREAIRTRAMAEFEGMVNNLRCHGVAVLLFDEQEDGFCLPDAVFPNNWLGTTREGEVHCFPMLTENRRKEVRPQALKAMLHNAGKQVSKLCFVEGSSPSVSLEGTGAMVLDHQHSRVFAALSERCDKDLLTKYASDNGFDEVISFTTRGSSGKPIYHTNVLLSIGLDTAVICSECIPDELQRERVLVKLQATHKVIDISYSQMAEQFCGNVLQLASNTGKALWVMSSSAFGGFTASQRRMLEASGKLVVNEINTIEQIGGGSCRCMLAEMFLPDAI